MGGTGSGLSSGKPTIESADCVVLPATIIRHLVNLRAPILINWVTLGGRVFPIECAFEATDSGTASLHLAYSSRTLDLALSTSTMDLVTIPQRFGGVRWWFLCPFTGRQVHKLYLPRGAREFRSRQAYGLMYASQRESPMEKHVHKARRLRRRLGDQCTELHGPIPLKPKWMRWRTYDACVHAIQASESAWIGHCLKTLPKALREQMQREPTLDKAARQSPSHAIQRCARNFG